MRRWVREADLVKGGSAEAVGDGKALGRGQLLQKLTAIADPAVEFTIRAPDSGWVAIWALGVINNSIYSPFWRSQAKIMKIHEISICGPLCYSKRCPMVSGWFLGYF